MQDTSIENSTGDSHDVKCIYRYTIAVRFHSLSKSTVLVYDFDLCSIWLPWNGKVTFENRTGDSQTVKCKYGYSSTVGFHLAPLPVVFVHFDYTIPAYAGFGRKVTCENRTAQRTYGFEFSTDHCPVRFHYTISKGDLQFSFLWVLFPSCDS